MAFVRLFGAEKRVYFFPDANADAKCVYIVLLREHFVVIGLFEKYCSGLALA